MEFPNGFQSWQQTHYDVVMFLSGLLGEPEHEDNKELLKIQYFGGRFAIYDIAEQWTTEFEKEHEGVVWGQEPEYADWWETLDEWLIQRNKHA